MAHYLVWFLRKFPKILGPLARFSLCRLEDLLESLKRVGRPNREESSTFILNHQNTYGRSLQANVSQHWNGQCFQRHHHPQKYLHPLHLVPDVHRCWRLSSDSLHDRDQPPRHWSSHSQRHPHCYSQCWREHQYCVNGSVIQCRRRMLLGSKAGRTVVPEPSAGWNYPHQQSNQRLFVHGVVPSSVRFAACSTFNHQKYGKNRSKCRISQAAAKKASFRRVLKGEGSPPREGTGKQKTCQGPKVFGMGFLNTCSVAFE